MNFLNTLKAIDKTDRERKMKRAVENKLAEINDLAAEIMMIAKEALKKDKISDRDILFIRNKSSSMLVKAVGLDYIKDVQAGAIKPRPLNEIAREIYDNYPPLLRVHAAPYIEVMFHLKNITDKFGADDAESIVLYFLHNATNWRGDVARRVKTELKELIKNKKQ